MATELLTFCWNNCAGGEEEKQSAVGIKGICMDKEFITGHRTTTVSICVVTRT